MGRKGKDEKRKRKRSTEKIVNGKISGSPETREAGREGGVTGKGTKSRGRGRRRQIP